MKFLFALIAGLFILSTSPSEPDKRLTKNDNSETENISPPNSDSLVAESRVSKKAPEEKSDSKYELFSNSHRYYVIIGSFRDFEKAEKYREQIIKMGFATEFLENNEGWYRISVMSTNKIDVAREELKRLQNNLGKPFISWILVQ